MKTSRLGFGGFFEALGPPAHCEGSKFTSGKKSLDVKNKHILMPNEKIDIKQFLITKDILLKNDYHQYEISNYSKKNKECPLRAKNASPDFGF